MEGIPGIGASTVVPTGGVVGVPIGSLGIEPGIAGAGGAIGSEGIPGVGIAGAGGIDGSLGIGGVDGGVIGSVVGVPGKGEGIGVPAGEPGALRDAGV